MIEKHLIKIISAIAINITYYRLRKIVPWQMCFLQKKISVGIQLPIPIYYLII